MRPIVLSIQFAILLFLTKINSTQAQHLEPEMLKKHVYILASDSLMGRGFGTQGGRMAADYIINQFQEIGLKPWEGQFVHPFISSGMMLKTEGANIIGWIEGCDPILRDEFILLGAHYDHLAYKINDGQMVVYNGADDNASGVASIIEIARWLVKNKDSLKRSVIVVAFDGEEEGLIGSNYLVKNKKLPLDQIKMMINLDMVGMLSKYGGVDLVGNETVKNGKAFFDSLASKHDIKIKKSGKRVEAQTDTQPFGKVGIPAVHVFTSTVSPYHKPGDDAEKLDYEGMSRIANMVADATFQLSTVDVLEPDKLFVAKSQGRMGVSFGLQAGFGNTYHDYSNEFYESKRGMSFSTGVLATFSINKRWSAQVQALYQTTGTRHLYGNFRTHELLVPVRIKYSLVGAANSILSDDFYLFGGANYSRYFAGKIGDGSYSFSDNMRYEAYGYHFGVGIDIMNYQMQLVTYKAINSIDRNGNILPVTTMFTIGYKF